MEMCDVVPISGLVMARFHILECELRTVIMRWGRDRKDLLAFLESKGGELEESEDMKKREETEERDGDKDEVDSDFFGDGSKHKEKAHIHPSLLSLSDNQCMNTGRQRARGRESEFGERERESEMRERERAEVRFFHDYVMGTAPRTAPAAAVKMALQSTVDGSAAVTLRKIASMKSGIRRDTIKNFL